MALKKQRPLTITVWNAGRVFYQEADDGVPEPALLIHADNGGMLVLQQEERSITINRRSLPELLAELRREIQKPGEDPETEP